MSMLLHILLFFASLLAMEFVARFSHKYIMHGLLWKLHKDHHTGSHHPLEHNDWFSLIFAIPSFCFVFWGLDGHNYYMLSIGAGMAAYGALYFIVHDIFIHQRIKLFRNTNNRYLKALRSAHRIHHRSNTKEQAESFGFLIVQKKYFKQSNSLFDKK